MTGPEDELRHVAEVGFWGHALTLNLLGNYLRYATVDHNIGHWREVPLLEEDAEQGNHAHSMLHAYENWLGPASRELAVVRLLALFDRPADVGCFNALRRPPAIHGLPYALSEDHWNRTLSRLEDLRLLTRTGGVESQIDSHPLVRQYFAVQFKTQQPEAWKAAHRPLYEHLRDTTPPLPDTLEGMLPLYHAVTHGCQAGLLRDAFQH